MAKHNINESIPVLTEEFFPYFPFLNHIPMFILSKVSIRLSISTVEEKKSEKLISTKLPSLVVFITTQTNVLSCVSGPVFHYMDVPRRKQIKEKYGSLLQGHMHTC